MAAAAARSSMALTVREGLAELTFDLPGEKLNLLRASVMEELGQIVSALARRSDVRCLLVRSGKPGSFIAGADIHEIEGLRDARAAEEKSRQGQDLFNALDDLPFPSLAVIDGACVGGGLELALACTWRIVSDNPKTQLGLPETTLGIVPGFGGSYRLPRAVGLVQALRMILSGRSVDGPRALRIGLAEACYPAAFLDDRAREVVARIAAGQVAFLPRHRRGAAARWIAEGNPVGRALVLLRARRDVEARGGKHYPALQEALKLLSQTVRSGRARALALERQALGRTLSTRVCRNLISLYFAREAARHLPPLPASQRAEKISSAAVIGAGVMGGTIAWLFAHHDIPAVMKDVSWEAVQKGFASAYETFKELERRGRGDSRSTGLGMHRLSGAIEYASLGKPDAVIEAVVEDLAVKKKVLAEVEARFPSEALLASNTSSLSITEMAQALSRPERFIGMHFFNPPSIMPLVEIIPGAATSPATVQRAASLALHLGKTPIIVRDCPGFLVNRLLMPYLNESVRLVEEGADFWTVDRLLKDFGMPMGPFALLDEIGIDVAIHVAGILGRAFADRMEPVLLLSSVGSAGGLLGKKSGQGFYLYGRQRPAGRGRRPNPNIRHFLSRPSSAASRFDVVHRPLLAMLNEAARVLEERVVSSARELDLSLILGTGFPPFRGGLLRWAEEELGIGRARELLEVFARTVGSRFAPAPLISRLANEGRGFFGKT